MYLKNLAINNIGPIDELTVTLPFEESGLPKPIVFVGENGSGKTILQSQIIDSFYEFSSNLFDDIGIQDGLKRSYYKVSGGFNLKAGKEKGFSLLSFIDNKNNKIDYFDKIGIVKKDDFVKLIPDFSLSPNNKNDSQKFSTEIRQPMIDELKKEWISGAYFYQPAYRYEEPFWKNDPFRDYLRFGDKPKYSGRLDKEIEIISATKDNKSYLMDLVLDFTNNPNNIIDKITWNNINHILRKIKRRDNIRFGIGPRGGSRVSIVELGRNGEITQQLLPSIDNLSLGESLLLNLFINIIRHGDNPPKLAAQIEGIVAIDEIDVHLHTDLQNSILPELIKLFPKIQFIITTHSPLFLLGMKSKFGEDGFEIRNMPNGEIITTERFSEFENAYKVLKETEKFEGEIKRNVENAPKPIVFVEGDYDIRYIKKAAELLNQTDVLEKVLVFDSDGFGNLNKIWKQFDTKLSDVLPKSILLLYDCDIKTQNNERGKVFKRTIPVIEGNIIDKGIENLFSKTTINKAIANKKAFIDITAKTKRVERGVEIVIPKKYEVNRNEKGNLCDWICENGTTEDFNNFQNIFKIIKESILLEDH